MAFPPQFLDELRSRLTLSEVVGKHVKLLRAGREYKACCPFHNEKTPSFTLNDAKGFFHCFGCGAHGDVIGFTMQISHQGFMEAVEQLAGMAGMQVPQSSPAERAQQEQQRSLYDLLDATARWYAAQLRKGPGTAALNYLRGRGLTDETMARFRLGYAPADGAALEAMMAAEGFTAADMMTVGLLTKPDDGRKPFAFFRNRVIFPITDGRGRVVAFGGRIMQGDGPKYLNSAESPIFRKGELLFNGPMARGAAAAGQPVVVVEGYLDVITMAQAGFEGGLAPLGTALTEAQLEALWRLMPVGRDGVKTPILCFDGDSAGIRAAHRAAERVLKLIQPDRTVQFVFLPAGEDPDSLLRRNDGGEIFRQCLAKPEPLVDYLWRTKLETTQAATPEQRAALRGYFLSLVEQIEDKGLTQLYRSAFLDRCYGLWGFKRGQKSGAALKAPAALPPRAIMVPPADVVLMAICLYHPEILDEFVDHIELVPFSSGQVHTIFKYASRLVDELGSGAAPAELQERLIEIDAEMPDLVAKLVVSYQRHANSGHRDADHVREVVHDIIRTLQIKRLQNDRDQAYQRWVLTGEAAEERRIAGLAADLERLLADRDLILDRHSVSVNQIHAIGQTQSA